METTAQNSNPPLAPGAVLAEQLAKCHEATLECFVCGSDANLSFAEQLASLAIAERLMRVSVALAAALDKSPREFTHRVIVERPTPAMIDVTPPAAGNLPPPKQKSKTIPGGQADEEHSIG